jgi:HEAT repeat protein
MEHKEFVECFNILESEPFFFFTKEDTARKLQCFEIFKENAKPQDIWRLIKFLKNKNSELRNGAAETIVVLFKKIESQTVFYANLKFIDFDINDLNYFKSAFSPAIYLNLLFIASINKSGYIREKAIKEIVSTQNPEALRFIIFRLADWVTNVRETAETALRSFFHPGFVDEFLRQLPLIEWLLKVERSDLTNIYDEIYQFLFGFEFNESFYQKLKQFDDKTRFIYIRNYLNSNTITKKIFELLSDEKLFLVKIELLKHIEKLDDETQKLFIRRFFKDQSAKVRVYAIYSTKPFRSEFYDEILDSIFDKSASVRELARFVLRESSIDFAELYRRRLKEDENSVAAILGLSEVRTQADLPIFESYIQKPNVKIKVACLTAINGLNKEIAKKYAIECLFHSSAKVRNKSIEILASTRSDDVLDIARELFQKGNYEQKKSVLKLFNQIGGWRVVGDFIIALSDANENIQELGWVSLEKWRGKQLFTKPLSEDLNRAKRLYDEFNKTKPELTYNHDRFWSELPFYLRW